jgi:hypothetical protein
MEALSGPELDRDGYTPTLVDIAPPIGSYALMTTVWP